MNVVRLIAALSLFAVSISDGFATNCVCRVVPTMYVGDGNWIHYSLACQTGQNGCVGHYPTSVISTPVSGEACNLPNLCNGCLSLGTSEDNGAAVDLFFDALKAAADLSTPEAFVPHLESLHPDNHGKYESTSLAVVQPFSLCYRKPVLVRLIRPAQSGDEEFYAIIWKVQDTLKGTFSYIGLEVSDDAPDRNEFEVINSLNTCNAQVTRKHDGHVSSRKAAGLLQVQISFDCLDTSRKDYAFIRLFRSDANVNAQWPLCAAP